MSKLNVINETDTQCIYLLQIQKDSSSLTSSSWRPSFGFLQQNEYFGMTSQKNHLCHVEQVSISPPFYVRLFCTKVLRIKLFLYLHFRFEIFWCKNIGANVLLKCWWNWPQDVSKCSWINLLSSYNLVHSTTCKKWG